MNQKRSITDIERFAVWKTWKGRCFWCRQHVLFTDSHIDHVIPLDAVSDANSAAKIRTMYGLASNFDFDSFDNWVPAHSGCNLRKSFLLSDPSPAFTTHITEVLSKKLLATETANTLRRDQSKAPLLAKISAAAQAGDITEDDIRRIFAGLPTIVRKADTLGFLTQDTLWIAPGWQVTEVRGSLVGVASHGGRFGMTSTSNHPSWICSQCGLKGPWNGVICLNCGNREEPD